MARVRTLGASIVMTFAALVLASGELLPVDASAQSRPPRAAREQTAPADIRPTPNQTRPLPEIVANVQATPPYSRMDYIGVAGFEMRTMVYVLRFLDGRQVVVVHVDARTGRILGRGP